MLKARILQKRNTHTIHYARDAISLSIDHKSSHLIELVHKWINQTVVTPNGPIGQLEEH